MTVILGDIVMSVGITRNRSMPMAIPARLSRALQERLGREAADSLVDWMGRMESNRSDIREVRQIVGQLDARFDRLESRFDDMVVRIGAMDAKFEKRFADLLKWSFVFWVSAVGAVAALAGVLRR